jgi:XTP/dITP diphosphohydrolase
MKQLLLASNNADKATEFRSGFAGLSITLKTLKDFPGFPPTDEDAPTLEGNAIKKAMEAWQRTKVPSLADDTGLEVFYLDGRPGVYSSRFAGPGATYADNCRKLLADMRGVAPRRRKAQFRCVLAFTPDGKTVHCVDGICPGVITETPSGGGGFGYDPIFLPDGYTQTFAEMSVAMKNTLSHRGKAIMAMKTVLAEVPW